MIFVDGEREQGLVFWDDQARGGLGARRDSGTGFQTVFRLWSRDLGKSGCDFRPTVHFGKCGV